MRPELRPYFGHRWRTVTRPRILERAGGRCERCGRPAHRLEVAHLVFQPPHPRHDRDDNLAALCCLCHKRFDYDRWALAFRRYLARQREARIDRKDAARLLLTGGQ